MKTFIFKTNLLQSKKIIREIEVLENTNLYDLAEMIIAAFGFDFDHAFGFFQKITEGWGGLDESERYELFADMENQGIEPTGSKSVKKTKIGEVWKNVGDKMMMLFDYGDEWRFAVELKAFSEKSAKTKYPRVLKTLGSAPAQYPDWE